MAGTPLAQGFLPIRELSTYQQRWTIRARVTARGPLRTFKKGDSNGKVFNVDLLDAEGGEIRANFFNQAVDTHYDRLLPGKCFTFARGNVRVANRQFNTCNHRYELMFDKDAQVEEVPDDGNIEAVKFTVSDLRAVQSRTLPCNVDLCGVVVAFRAPYAFTSRDGKELVKRDITIADDTGLSMAVTLWGDRAKQEDKNFDGKPMVALKGVVVKEWGQGRSGSLLEAGVLDLKPKLPEAERIRQWWAGGGASQQLTALSQEGGASGGPRVLAGRPASLADVRRAAEQATGQTEMMTVVCRLALVQTKKQGEPQPLQYLACQEPKEGNSLPCNRRLDESGFCITCNRAGKAAPRLNVRCRFSDHEDSAWLTTFHEGAQRVLHMDAAEVRAMERAENGREALEAAIRNKYFREPLQVTIRAKEEMYQGERRVNVTCIDARPVPKAEHGRQLLREIEDMLASETVRVGAGGA